jgi:hypothetical protein
MESKSRKNVSDFFNIKYCIKNLKGNAVKHGSLKLNVHLTVSRPAPYLAPSSQQERRPSATELASLLLIASQNIVALL